MIALEISRNGKRVCVAGGEDLAVLTANLTAVGKLGRKTVRARLNGAREGIHLTVHAFTARPSADKDAILRWKPAVPLRVGDAILVTILETRTVDRPTSSQRAHHRPGEQAGSR